MQPLHPLPSDMTHSSPAADLAAYQTALQAGQAFVAQAQAIAPTDFTEARRLWRHAGGAFHKAHQLAPEQHEAAFRLAQALAAEAHAMQKEESPDAVHMWRRAAVQGEAAFDLNPNHPQTAMHTASCYAWAQDPESAQAWAQIAQHLLQPQKTEEENEPEGD